MLTAVYAVFFTGWCGLFHKLNKNEEILTSHQPMPVKEPQRKTSTEWKVRDDGRLNPHYLFSYSTKAF